ncbi:MAG: translation initiation factor IF-2 [Candidatus Lokiarchaeota archaeon]|nr:translation initiation factor IF-2 [Candidatus Lokiarchaeota archaeon]
MSEQNPNNKKIRQPIVTILGHIDHGKTSLLDYVRGTLVQKREAAGITQHIGASFFPIKNILEFCGPKYQKMKINIPGLLVVDTPGHAAFMNLRRRGGAVADIAILVIDVTAGTMPITWESVRILRERKVPFIIAANKIDLLHGWKSIEKADFMETYKQQPDFVQQDLDMRIYQLVGDFIEEGFPGCERYDRIQDFTKNIAIVPTSAKTGEGIPTLLMVLIGLVQQYLQKRIQFSEGAAKGVVLEKKQDSHLGISLDCLIYDGILKRGENIVIGGIPHAVKTKVRAILIPNELDEIRDPENKFLQQQEVFAAAGIKILAPNIEHVVAGAPLRGVPNEENLEEVYQEIEEELGEIQIETEDEGVILKADTLGSLEAIVNLFRENEVKIRTARVGSISKRDIMEAVAVRDEDPYNAVVLGFNVEILKDAIDASYDQDIRIFTNDVIYRLMEEFKEYRDKRKEEDVLKEFSDLIPPGKFEIIPDYIFRKSDPAVVGVKVLAGKLTPKTRIVNQEGVFVGRLHQIQENNQTIKEAEKGKEVALSIRNATIGRNLKVEDTLYIYVPESHVRTYNGRFRDELSEDQIELMREYIRCMRKKNSPYWGL